MNNEYLIFPHAGYKHFLHTFKIKITAAYNNFKVSMGMPKCMSKGLRYPKKASSEPLGVPVLHSDNSA
jgi:hypothetical protein